jgi:hypothetical protein
VLDEDEHVVEVSELAAGLEGDGGREGSAHAVSGHAPDAVAVPDAALA